MRYSFDVILKTVYHSGESYQNQPLWVLHKMPTSQPTVSIITPSFNQGQFIQKTIDSVLTQHIANLEYIICDGGSSDNTLDVIKQYEGSLKWISEPDKGQTDALNKGIENTHGEIIGWLNSDDIFYPNSIQTVLDYFATHPEIDVVYGQANFIDVADNILGLYPTQSWDPEALKVKCFLSQPSVFFRRRVIEKAGLLNVNFDYCMDYEYWIRLMLKGAQFAYITSILSATRIYPETKTASAQVRIVHEINTLLKQHLGAVPSPWLMEYATVKLRNSKIATKKNIFRTGIYIPILVIYAGLKWNHMIYGSDIKMLHDWFKKNIQIMLTKTKGRMTPQ